MKINIKIISLLTIVLVSVLVFGCGFGTNSNVGKNPLDEISVEAYNLKEKVFSEKYRGKTIIASGNVKSIKNYDTIKDAVVIQIDANNKILSSLSGVFNVGDVKKFNIIEGDNITVEIPYGNVIIKKEPIIPYSLELRKFQNLKEVHIQSSELINEQITDVRSKILGKYSKTIFDIRELSNEFTRLGQMEFTKRYSNKNIRVFGWVETTPGFVGDLYRMHNVFHLAYDEKKNRFVKVIVEGMRRGTFIDLDYVVMDGKVEGVEYTKDSKGAIDGECVISLVSHSDMGYKKNETKYFEVLIKKARHSYSTVGDLRRIFDLVIGEKYSPEKLTSGHGFNFIKYSEKNDASLYELNLGLCSSFYHSEFIPYNIGYACAVVPYFNKENILYYLDMYIVGKQESVYEWLVKKYGKPHRVVDDVLYEWEDDGIILWYSNIYGSTGNQIYIADADYVRPNGR